MQQHGRLIDIVNHLEPGAQLCTTGEADELPNVQDASIMRALGAIVEAGACDLEAELSADGHLIRLIDGNGDRTPAFHVC